MDPIVKQRSKRACVARHDMLQPDQRAIGAVETTVRRGLRETTLTPAAVRRQAAPYALPAQASEAVGKAQQRGVGNSGQQRLMALPLFPEDARTIRKDRAGSELRARLAEWLRSDDAAAWRQDRESIFRGPLANDMPLDE